MQLEKPITSSNSSGSSSNNSGFSSREDCTQELDYFG